MAQATLAGGSLTYHYENGSPDRLASLTVSGANPGVAGGSIIYDAAGRITAGAGYAVSYDRRGLTAEIQRDGHTAMLAYAPDGHRYRLTVDGKATYYLAGGAFRVVTGANGVVSYRQAVVG